MTEIVGLDQNMCHGRFFNRYNCVAALSPMLGDYQRLHRRIPPIRRINQGSKGLLLLREGTPLLHLAAERGHIDIVRSLLCRGFSVDSSDPQGRSALYVAASKRKAGVVGHLILSKTALDKQDDTGQTALYKAVNFG